MILKTSPPGGGLGVQAGGLGLLIRLNVHTQAPECNSPRSGNPLFTYVKVSISFDFFILNVTSALLGRLRSVGKGVPLLKMYTRFIIEDKTAAPC